MDEGAVAGKASLPSIRAQNLDLTEASQLSQAMAGDAADAPPAKLTTGEKTAALERLVADLWLEKSDKGHYMIGVRAGEGLGYQPAQAATAR